MFLNPSIIRRAGNIKKEEKVDGEGFVLCGWRLEEKKNQKQAYYYNYTFVLMILACVA